MDDNIHYSNSFHNLIHDDVDKVYVEDDDDDNDVDYDDDDMDNHWYLLDLKMY